ncbi:protein kinase domain-containing protein [Nostoc sp. 'Peltigera membranacea cyanobiont' 232]|uniref:serine/threonine-protein kinase n=1 Tax=Nostoc sp. 'Peltigera membranacea cyanobiont' 232 TaxID=2014531 RepID=UPI000B951535|nr:serine/threonine-protein kinase [Nostoc sp. 'Peltigera membranacea cyanobiont' 232]OYE00226.1 protein kinase [Nostoc sp. 'Peltigera membranacea cyanobiont' 232]
MKVLKLNSPKLVELIERESLSLRLIHHPNIPKSTLDDFFTFVPVNSSLTLYCLVMDKIEGQNLEQWIESNGRILQSQALEWLKELVEILAAVHRANFFHRDIKPSNIILQSSGQLALVDFGVARRVTSTYLAKISGSGGDSTSRGGKYEITSVGTPRYSPPEQTDGQAVPQSDFYALGRTFVHLLTAIQLIDLPTDKQTGRLIWRNKAPQIDKPFADFIDELTAPLPGQRPQSTEVILQRLKLLPQQSKIYRLTRSKTFRVSAAIGFMILTVFVTFKVLLPLRAKYLLSQGEKAEAANNFQTAQEFFDSAIKINPQARYIISKFYFEKGLRSTKSLELAKRYYELAIKYNHTNVESYNNLGIVCKQLQDSGCVIDSYEKAFKLTSDNWEGHYGLGTYYDERMKYDLAEQQYQLAIKINRQAIIAINNLSRVKILQGDYNTAISLAQGGLQKTTNFRWQAVLYKNLGWAKFEQKKYSEAKRYLEKAKELDIQRTSTHCLLAKVEGILGDFDNSWLSWEACLLTESREPEVFIWRAEIIERIRQKAPNLIED